MPTPPWPLSVAYMLTAFKCVPWGGTTLQNPNLASSISSQNICLSQSSYGGCVQNWPDHLAAPVWFILQVDSLPFTPITKKKSALPCPPIAASQVPALSISHLDYLRCLLFGLPVSHIVSNPPSTLQLFIFTALHKAVLPQVCFPEYKVYVM